jgi:predicted outer membrane protein
MKLRVLLLLGVTAFGVPVFAQEGADVPLMVKPPAGLKLYSVEIGGRDLRFLTDALEIGQTQVFLCELAEKRAQSEQVKTLAGVLKQTQRDESGKLVWLAAAKGVTLGAKEAATQKALTAKFAKVEGVKFDKLWFDEITAVNQRAVTNCESVAESSDPDIKSFAQATLPLARQKLLVVNKVTGNASPLPTDRSAPAPVTPAPR